MGRPDPGHDAGPPSIPAAVPDPSPIPETQAPQVDRPRAAVLAMLVAVATFTLMDAALKLLAPHYPPLQVAAMRGMAALPLALGWALATVGARALVRVHWPLHLLRGVLAVGFMALFVRGLRDLPLSTAYAIAFVAPLLVTALAVPLLGEKVGPRRWVAVAVGMAGVLVILRPGTDGLATVAGLSVLAAAVFYSLAAITVRPLARRDSAQAMVVWFLALLALGAGLLAWPGWVPVQPAHGWLVAAVGVTGMLGQVALTRAFRLGEASLVAPLEYTALVWVVLLDVALWGVLPDAATWAGAAIIVASGLYLMRREPPSVPTPPTPGAG